jgi:hypothetical protein
VYDHLSKLAQQVGRHMAQASTSGLPTHFDDGLLVDFPTVSERDMKYALSELRADGLVELTSVMGPRLPRIRTTYELYAAADPGVTSNDPRADAVSLARTLVQDPALGHIPDLETASGWTRRRFNPALGLLMPLFRKGRYREVTQNDYPTLGLIVSDDEVVALRRFITANA